MAAQSNGPARRLPVSAVRASSTWRLGGTINATGAGTLTVDSVISPATGSTGGLTINSAIGASGTVILAAANTYVGPTTISGGTVTLNVANALQNTSMVSLQGGQLQLNGFGTALQNAILNVGAGSLDYGTATSVTVAGLQGSGTLTLPTTMLTVSGAANTAYSGSLNSTAGSFTKAGPGTLTLSGDNSSHLGRIVLNGGILRTTTNAGTLAPETCTSPVNCSWPTTPPA